MNRKTARPKAAAQNNAPVSPPDSDPFEMLVAYWLKRLADPELSYVDLCADDDSSAQRCFAKLIGADRMDDTDVPYSSGLQHGFELGIQVAHAVATSSAPLAALEQIVADARGLIDYSATDYANILALRAKRSA